MLVSLNEILYQAERSGTAAGSFNTPTLESVRAVVAAAEELDLPVILQFAQCHDSWIPLEEIGPIMVRYAERARVPICVHLDHGEDLEYLRKALRIGFTGIMYDGSALPYEENLRNTKKAAEMARASGAGTEAELGCMGRRESGAGDKSGDQDETKIYTDPQLAGEFVDETGIDALACSFGTTHGIYLKKPKLDFNVVRSVRNVTGRIPVVMHGGSGVSREDFHEAIRAGVRKINYFTYMDKSGGSAAKELLEKTSGQEPAFFSSVCACARRAMQEDAAGAMRTFALLDL